MSMTLLSSQLAQLVRTSESEEHSREEKRKALKYARQLCSQLETPVDTAVRTSWLEPAYYASMQVCNNLGVFHILGHHRPKYLSVEDIVAKIRERDPNNKLQPGLLVRYLRHLAAMGAISEREPGEYAATPLTEGFREDRVIGVLEFLFTSSGPMFSAMPTFMKSTDYENPEDSTNCSWQAGKQTAMTFYEWHKANPEAMRSFSNMMEGYASDRGLWTDIYPATERVIDGADEAAPLVVDVGGSKGHDMLRFATSHHISPKRLCVQDTEVVITPTKASDTSGLQLMVHDFFTPQPVKHARAYFMHSIMHNWSNDDCVKILGQLKGAMKPGYSKVLINDQLMPTTGCDPLVSGLDLVMLAAFGGGVKERTKDEFEAILRKAGLKMSGVWNNPEIAREAIIEAEVA